jgi:hypothetical protein
MNLVALALLGLSTIGALGWVALRRQAALSDRHDPHSEDQRVFRLRHSDLNPCEPILCPYSLSPAGRSKCVAIGFLVNSLTDFTSLSRMAAECPVANRLLRKWRCGLRAVLECR